MNLQQMNEFCRKHLDPLHISVFVFYNDNMQSHCSAHITYQQSLFGYVEQASESIIYLRHHAHNILSDSEILAVLAHEMGHAVTPRNADNHIEELTADMDSLRLGGNAINLISALVKLDTYNHVLLDQYSNTHPSTNTRAKALGVNVYEVLQAIELGIL